MDKFIIQQDPERITSINRTIRLKPEVYDKICLISERTGISFNRVVGQCLEFALDRYVEEDEDVFTKI